MKKSLLLAFAMIFAIAVNAQEICMWDWDEGDYEGFDGTESVQSAGHVFAKTDNVTISMAYDETAKSSAIKGSTDPYQGYTIGGVQYPIQSGATGSANPSGVSITTGPTAGWVIRVDVAKDGYLYFLGKLSSNKPYYVWEGVIGEGEMLVAYNLDMCLQSTESSIQVISYSLPGDEYGWYDASQDDGTYSSTGSTLNWPEVIYTKDASSAIKLNGIGLIHFPVYAEVGTYYVHASGSKITCGGAILADEALGEIAFTTEEYSDGEETGITEIAATSSDVNAPVYNLAGQRVAANVKGILIQNGKKFINK